MLTAAEMLGDLLGGDIALFFPPRKSMAPKITTERPFLVSKVPWNRPPEQVTGDCSGRCYVDTAGNSPPFFFILSIS